jgi:hypothetical protein
LIETIVFWGEVVVVETVLDVDFVLLEVDVFEVSLLFVVDGFVLVEVVVVDGFVLVETEVVDVDGFVLEVDDADDVVPEVVDEDLSALVDVVADELPEVDDEGVEVPELVDVAFAGSEVVVVEPELVSADLTHSDSTDNHPTETRESLA